jgi:hypothetical protein
MSDGKQGGGSQRSTPAGERGGNRGGPSKENDPTRQGKAGQSQGSPNPQAGGGGPKLPKGGEMGRGPKPTPQKR